jgi:SAM-dependent methyltransferase
MDQTLKESRVPADEAPVLDAAHAAVSPATVAAPLTVLEPPLVASPDLESSSDRYALRFSGPGGRFLLDRQCAGIRRLIALTGACRMRVLDVGGGHMQVAPLLSAMGHSVVVHGSAPAALLRVNAQASGNEPRLETRLGPFVPLPADSGEFDMVISVRMIGHFARWRDLLAEQCRASKRFVAVEFASSGGFQRFSRTLFGLKHWIEGDTRRYATHAIGEVGRELARHGFQLMALDRQFVLPLLVHRTLRNPALSGGLETALERAGLARRIGNPVILLAVRTPTPRLTS